MIEEEKMKKTKWLASALLALTLAVSAAGLAACGHEHTLVKTDAVAATCTEAGSAEYWKCSDCGKIFADAAGEKATTLVQLATEALGHDYELTASVADGKYIEGTTLPASAVTYTLVCSRCDDGQSVTGVEADLSKELVVGKNEFTATYAADGADYEVTFEVTAVAKSLTDIEIEYTGKTEYTIGESFEKDKLTVTAKYDNGSEVDVTSEATVSELPASVGAGTVTVSFGGMEKTISVTMKAPEATLESITVEYTGKTEYTIGESFEKDKLTVTAKYDNGSEVDVTSEATVSELPASVGAGTVTVSFGGMEKTISVTMKEAPVVTEELFEAEDGEWRDGETPYGPITVFSNSDCTYLSGMNSNYLSELTFTVNATADTTAMLIVRLNRRSEETVFTDLVGVSVNGGAYLESDVVVPAMGEDEGSEWGVNAYTVVEIGELSLSSGSNTLTFTMLSDAPYYSGYNFDWIKLRGSYIEPFAHECGEVCPECGKCMDLYCGYPSCEDKCGGHDGAVFEAEDAVILDGESPLWGGHGFKENSAGRKYVTCLNGNIGATVTFTVNAEKDTTVSLVVTNNMRRRETRFTDVFDVLVNGESIGARPVVVPASENQYDESAFRDFCLGCITLQEGENTIVLKVNGWESSFEGEDPHEYSGYDIDKITLVGEGVLLPAA